MSAHYRSPMNYSHIHLESASDRVFYIYEVLFSQTLVVVPVCLCSLQDFFFFASDFWTFLFGFSSFVVSFICCMDVS